MVDRLLADIVPSIQRLHDYYSSNVLGTFNVVECAKDAGIRKLVYAAYQANFLQKRRLRSGRSIWHAFKDFRGSVRRIPCIEACRKAVYRCGRRKQDRYKII
jgi:hypothetical protein